MKDLLTSEYIDGSQNMLTTVVAQLNSSLTKFHDGKASGAVNALNEFLAYLYFKQETIEDMRYELARQEEFLKDPFEEQACTDMKPKFYVLKDGKITLIKGGI